MDCSDSGWTAFGSGGISTAGAVWPKKPGMRKVAGETPCEVLIPVQPVPNSAKAGITSNQALLQNIRIVRDYR